MTKRNVTQQITAEVSNDVAQTQEQVQDTTNSPAVSVDTVQFLVDTMNSLINYINIANSRGALSLEEAGTIWNIIKNAQERLK